MTNWLDPVEVKAERHPNNWANEAAGEMACSWHVLSALAELPEPVSCSCCQPWWYCGDCSRYRLWTIARIVTGKDGP